jgi:hypothetical protein
VVEEAKVRAFALAESRARLDAQRDDLDQFRTRLGAQLTIGAAVATLLAGAAFARAGQDGFRTDAWLWIGIGCFGAMAALDAWLLWPRKFAFHNDGRVILEDYADQGRTLSETHWWITGFNTDNADANEERFRWLARGLAIGGGLLVAEVASLTWFLISHL